MNWPYGLSGECNCCHLHLDNYFCALSGRSIEDFNKIKRVTVFPDGAVIFTEGQAPHGVFMLCQGQVKLSTGSDRGKTLIVRIAKAGEVLGLHEIVSNKAYELTAETMQPSQLSFVSGEDFIRFVKQHGDALLRTAQHISRDCQEAYQVARTIGLSYSATWKIAKFLLASATEGKIANGVLRAKLGMTHEEIAQLVGTSRETITRILADLRKRNIVELRGSTLIIHDKTALERLLAA